MGKTYKDKAKWIRKQEAIGYQIQTLPKSKANGLKRIIMKGK